VNVGFFHGAALPDPAGLLQGAGKCMRHVKLRPGTPTSEAALFRLVEAAYSDIQARTGAGVAVRSVYPRMLAAVRREVAPGGVGAAWGPALAKVWPFIRSQPGLWTDGHNVFVYHHPKRPGAPILCEFGVEVTRAFEAAGEVCATQTPGGEAAVAVHRGPYNRMHETHQAIREWMFANRRESAGQSWEIYGDPTPDPAETETTIAYLLR
jgi:effector-binding domain-containing protein